MRDRTVPTRADSLAPIGRGHPLKIGCVLLPAVSKFGSGKAIPGTAKRFVAIEWVLEVVSGAVGRWKNIPMSDVLRVVSFTPRSGGKNR
jgi:hypothetical protein